MKRNLQLIKEVRVSGFSKKGHGCGHTIDGPSLPVEVPFAIPGDHVRALLTRKRQGMYSSRLEEVLTPSPLRIIPRCVHFGFCGGCRWQQLSYQDQLRIKQEHIGKLFSSFLSQGMSIQPIIPCDSPWQYRNKMEFSFSNDSAGKTFLGLILDGSRGKVLNLTECHLVNPWFITALKATHAWWNESGLTAYHPHTNTGSLRTLILREGIRTGDRLAMLTVSGNPDYALHQKQLDSFVAFLRDAIEPDIEAKLSIILRIQQAIKGRETNFYEIVLYLPDQIREILHVQLEKQQETKTFQFGISPSAFFQPNTKQAERLYGLAMQMLGISDCVVYDLYCGTGTLGICAAKQAKAVVGIELSPESALDARTNAAKNGLDNLTILTGSVSEVISTIRRDHSHPLPEIVMVDPPRVGLDSEMIKHLGELKPRKILYISCNPDTQAANIKQLRPFGYKVAAVQPVDQFPQTIHIENIVVLELT